MSKKRKDIRNEVVSVLKRANIVIAANILANRSIPYESKLLPAISVYTRADEVAGEFSSAPRLLKKSLELIVEVVLQDQKDDVAADRLDDLCEKVEDYLSSDDSLNGKCDDIYLSRVDFDFQGEQQEKPMHSAVMVFTVLYNDYEPRSRFLQGNINDFVGADAQYQVGHNNSEPDQALADRAKDTIDVPQI